MYEGVSLILRAGHTKFKFLFYFCQITNNFALIWFAEIISNFRIFEVISSNHMKTKIKFMVLFVLIRVPKISKNTERNCKFAYHFYNFIKRKKNQNLELFVTRSETSKINNMYDISWKIHQDWLNPMPVQYLKVHERFFDSLAQCAAAASLLFQLLIVQLLEILV